MREMWLMIKQAQEERQEQRGSRDNWFIKATLGEALKAGTGTAISEIVRQMFSQKAKTFAPHPMAVQTIFHMLHQDQALANIHPMIKMQMAHQYAHMFPVVSMMSPMFVAHAIKTHLMTGVINPEAIKTLTELEKLNRPQ